MVSEIGDSCSVVEVEGSDRVEYVRGTYEFKVRLAVFPVIDKNKRNESYKMFSFYIKGN